LEYGFWYEQTILLVIFSLLTIHTAYLTPVAAPVLTFAVFSVLARNSANGTTLDTARVFTSLSLFVLLSDPLASLMIAAVQFAGSAGSFKRIQEFLDAEARKDPRVRPTDLDNASGSSHGKISSRSSELGREKIRVLSKPKENNTISLHQNAITVTNGNFGWDKEKPNLLADVNLAIPKGKLTMIVGPVGCGKSTLLKGLLGEVPEISGTIQVPNSAIAFCDQTAWHTNSTIRESIIALSPIDHKWYNTVIRACALEEDLQQLPLGDKTVIGSNGIALSGGQSQRIAIARAIYAQTDLLIFDDNLGGLDATTERHVFHNLFGQDGLVRRQNATTILASSSSKRLPYADHIIVLNSEGKIVEQGKFDELDKTGGYVSSFELRSADWTYDIESEFKSDDTFLPDEKEMAVTQILEAQSGKIDGDSKIYLYYVGSVGWFATSLFVVAICGYAFCTSFPTIWVQWWSVANASQPNQNLGYWLGVYGVLGAGALISLLASVYQMLIKIMPRSGETFHRELLRTVLHAPMSFFATTDTGITINRFSQDLQLIDMDLPLAALNTTVTLVLCLAQMILIGVESIYAAISFPLCIVAFYLIQKFYLRTSRQMRFLDLESKSPLYSQFVECLNGLATIRAFGWQDALANKNLDLLDRSQRPFYLLWSIQRWLTLVLDLVVAALAVLLIALVVALRGTLSAGAVGVALVNVISFSQNLKLLLQFWTNLETHIGAVSRIKTFTEEMVPEDLPSEKEEPPATWPSSGGIEFRNVSASYRFVKLIP
jgi:ATP-binding cassette, subfamily C (CFTR/MRP), member 1